MPFFAAIKVKSSKLKFAIQLSLIFRFIFHLSMMEEANNVVIANIVCLVTFHNLKMMSEVYAAKLICFKIIFVRGKYLRKAIPWLKHL